MKTWKKSALCILLSLLCTFSCVGYAAMSSSLAVSGNIDVEPAEPEGLYISKVVVHASNGVQEPRYTVILPTTLETIFSITPPNSSITYEITVHNKSDMTYWFLGTKMDTANANNSFITSISTRDFETANSSGFDTNDWVPPQSERTFYATYTFSQNAIGSITTFVNFSFGLKAGSVSDGFLKILNTESTYNILVDAFEEEYPNSTVLDNVGAPNEVFDELFGENICIDVGGEKKPVTIMIARRDVDGNLERGDTYDKNSVLSGCEYTVYFTTDDVTDPANATVYAVSYTRGDDGVWYQLAELYEGKCNVGADDNDIYGEDYGAYDPQNDTVDGEFYVDRWVATPQEYTIMPGLTYKVGQSGGQAVEMYNEIEELMIDQYDSVLRNGLDGIKPLLREIYNTAYSFTRTPSNQLVILENSANIGKPGYQALLHACEKLRPYCILQNGFYDGLQGIEDLGRSDFVPMLEEVYEAYTYYMSVNPQ